MVPLPIPPKDGLQLHTPRLSYEGVTRVVRAPVLAAAAEASHPAWPPPMTTTSTGGLGGRVSRLVLLSHRSVHRIGLTLCRHDLRLSHLLQWPAHAGLQSQIALEANGPKAIGLLLTAEALCGVLMPAQDASRPSLELFDACQGLWRNFLGLWLTTKRLVPSLFLQSSSSQQHESPRLQYIRLGTINRRLFEHPLPINPFTDIPLIRQEASISRTVADAQVDPPLIQASLFILHTTITSIEIHPTRYHHPFACTLIVIPFINILQVW